MANRIENTHETSKKSNPSDIEVNEVLRRVVSVNGHEQRFSNVKTLNNTGSWTRLECDQGYVVINNDNVLAFIIKGPRVI